ncbi:hypothetical protein [Sporomusa acidovorans]|uniref:Nucleoside 2-deoxyribosyltransferase n=1 Tax=Sporomusa acidovorans (strain ATCC 49682 / DSM 3132 / Mol) TaxID=1123286 RepID=A0ABZ3JAV2_SPOA4|nr:hypothetical protein [Sporomusa acidovorans]OZC17010.1 hypothetical protein SPACI_39810 [Sporomusa acidovorans DSM 3132]SDF34125.1 hypothetical protein SAMN04488499_104438 [Sporomusa acidovorans]
MINIYFAGKVVPAKDWRRGFSTDWRSEILGIDVGKYRPLKQVGKSYSIDKYFGYAGPFFSPCGEHFSGDGFHGMNDWDYVMTTGGVAISECPEQLPIFELADHVKKGTFSRCEANIKSADWIFCWINSMDCYGTLVELGMANAYNKKVFIGLDSKIDGKEIWFALEAANKVVTCNNVLGAWMLFWKLQMPRITETQANYIRCLRKQKRGIQLKKKLEYFNMCEADLLIQLLTGQMAGNIAAEISMLVKGNKAFRERKIRNVL